MRWTPSVVVIEPGICAGLDRDETVHTVFVGHRASGSCEIWVEWGRMLVFYMRVATSCIGLPDFNQSIGDRTAIVIEHTASHDDALPVRLFFMLPGQVAVGFTDLTMPVDRPGNLRQTVRKINERLRW